MNKYVLPEETVDDFKLYQYRKTTRFNLEIRAGELDKPNLNSTIDIVKFIESGKKISENLKALFDENILKKNDVPFKNSILLHKRWLKTYEGLNFSLEINKNKYKFVDLLEVKNNILTKLKEFDKEIKLLSKNSDFSFIILKLQSRKYFGYLKDLIEFVDFKGSVKLENNSKFEEYKKLKQKLIKEFKIYKKLLLPIKNFYLSSQSFGVEIVRASFNYYTVNKKPEELKEKFEDLENELKKEKYSSKFISGNILNFEKEIITNIKQNNSHRNKEKLNIENLCELIKTFKSRFRSKLFEECQKGEWEHVKNLKSKIFENKKNLEAIFNLTKKIEEISKQNNLQNKEDIEKLRKNRRNYLNIRSKKCVKSWKDIINNSGTNLKELGCLKAKIRAIERQKIEADLLKYWALILNEDNENFLLLIPRDKMQNVKKKIEELSKNKNDNKKLTIYRFNSLTQRALYKLCFGEESTFFNEMKNQDFEMYSLIESAKNTKGKREESSNKLSEKEKLMLKVYKKILFTKYVRERLNLKNFNLNELKNAKNLEESQKILEKNCYNVQKIKINSNELKDLIESEEIIKCLITSYDIEKKYEKNDPKSKPKLHTQNLWNAFWENKNSEIEKVRLNPEIRIHFKRKDLNLEKYLKEKGVDTNKLENRNLKDKYLVALNFTLNPGQIYPELAFAKTDNLLEKIRDFNKKLNVQLGKSSYFYGIDLGEAELASLCIVKFKDEEHSFKAKNGEVKEFNNSELKKFEYYILKKEKYNSEDLSSLEKNINTNKERKKRKIIANVSYFIDKISDENYFEKKYSAAIDLTCAKVIKGRIVENADVLTYLQYIKKVAKRKISELYNKGKISDSSKFSWQGEEYKNTLCLDNEKVYSFKWKHKDAKDKNNYTYTKESIMKCFEKFKNELCEDESKDKNLNLKLNCLRDSLVANMIGVISFLFEKNKKYIVLEKLEPGRAKEDKMIVKRLELALYKKFQTFGMVPPHVKNLLEVKEKLIVNKKNSEKKNKENNKEIEGQIGNIVFINEKNTSKTCPRCGKVKTKGNDQVFYNMPKSPRCGKVKTKGNEEKKKGHFVCDNGEKCFSTKNPNAPFESLNTCDKLAAYNIAKKGFEYLNGREHNNFKS